MQNIKKEKEIFSALMGVYLVLCIGLGLIAWRLVESVNDQGKKNDSQNVVIGEIFGVVLLGLICLMMGGYILYKYFLSFSL